MSDKKRTRLQAHGHSTAESILSSSSATVADRPTKKPKKSTKSQGSKNPDLSEWPHHFHLVCHSHRLREYLLISFTATLAIQGTQ